MSVSFAYMGLNPISCSTHRWRGGYQDRQSRCSILAGFAQIEYAGGISLETKLKIFKAVILPSLLYECEICTVYSRRKSLNHFLLSCLGKCWSGWTKFLTPRSLPGQAWPASIQSLKNSADMGLSFDPHARGMLTKEATLHGETLQGHPQGLHQELWHWPWELGEPHLGSS